jgi:hypothetical protein
VVGQDVQTALEQAHYGYALKTGQEVLPGGGATLLRDSGIRSVFLRRPPGADGGGRGSDRLRYCQRCDGRR